MGRGGRRITQTYVPLRTDRYVLRPCTTNQCPASSPPSNSDVPHLCVLQPNHDLNARFVRALREQTSESDWVPLVDVGAAGAEEEEEEGEGPVEEADDAAQ